MLCCVLVSHKVILLSIPAATSSAPFGDQAAAVESPVRPAEKARCFVQFVRETTCRAVLPLAKNPAANLVSTYFR